MLDDPFKTAILIDLLNESLPFEITLTPALIKSLAEKDDPVNVNPTGIVSDILYMGETGGITCCIEAPDGSLVLASITHLRVHRSFPFSREVLAYQKHRVKKLKKEWMGGYGHNSGTFDVSAETITSS